MLMVHQLEQYAYGALLILYSTSISHPIIVLYSTNGVGRY